MRLAALTLGIAAILACALADHNGLGQFPAMGWSTWCTMGDCYQDGFTPKGPSLHDVCYEWEILEVAQAMLENGMYDAGYNRINLDDCWAYWERDANGNLQGDPSRFPNGMQSFVASVHALGFKVGLYTSAGAETCSSGQRPYPIPGSWGHYQQDSMTFANWGVDFMKMDWCDTSFNNTKLNPSVATGEMWHSINATGHPMWLNFHCIGYERSISSQWCATYGDSFRILDDHHDNWPSTISIIDGMYDPAHYVGEDAWNDPDFLMTGGAGCDNETIGMRCPGQTNDEYMTEFSLWSLAGGQLIVATDLRNMTSFMSEVLLNYEILAVFNDSLKRPGHRVDWDLLTRRSVWVRPLADGCAAVALLNAGSKSQDITAHARDFGMGWDDHTTLTVRDLWAHADLPNVTGDFTVKDLATHATSMVKMCKSNAAAGKVAAQLA